MYRATPAGQRSLGTTIERTRLAYAQDAAGRGWDRRWRLVAFAVPEARRADRDALRDRLLALGGAAIHNGLYVSPHRWDADVLATAEDLGVVEHVMLASTDDLSVGGDTDPVDIASRLWRVDELAARYERFIEEYGGVPDALEQMRKRKERLTDTEFMPGALLMAMRFQECFNADPLLPPELLPRPWPGRAARDVVIRSRRLGVLAREKHDRPSLFRTFDEALETIG
jgi:phenylacetic acid degradation operon negative regulatory protein